jgi:CheY-like chemotaxis protein
VTVDVDVLVVDDEHDAAQVFAELIATRTKLQTVVASTPADALTIAEESQPKVLVLDELMPIMKGTELFSHLRRLLPDAAAIMLTQEEDVDDAVTATNLGYRYHMHKSRIVELPAKVLELYIETIGRMLASESATPPVTVLRKRRRWGFGGYYELILVSSEVMEERHVADLDWRAYTTVNAGQTIVQETKVESSGMLRIEAAEGEEIGFSCGVSIPTSEISVGLQSALVHHRRTTEVASSGSVERLEETFRLAAEPANPTTLHVKTRQFELAPVFRRVRAVLDLTCSVCNQRSKLALGILEPTDLVALRHTDYLSDGTKRITDTGFRSVRQLPEANALTGGSPPDGPMAG